MNFHAPYGTHFSVRVPKFGRDLVYNWQNCDLYIGGAGDEIYRMNLEAGQFREPLVASFVGINKMHLNPVHGLLGVGGDSASCEFFDARARKSVSKLLVSTSTDTQISAFRFDSDGLTLGVGTSEGSCLLYDIRSSKPMFTKEHQYGLPIVDITFHNSGLCKRVISSDKKIIKIWERENSNGKNMGEIVANIEPTVNLNAVHVVQDARGESGLLFVAGEQSRMMSYFIPQLGPAPRWCTFLESLTEELEETSAENGGSGVYEDYKFITRAEVEELGATALIGTPMLKGYMHGFFVEMKLYSKLRAVSKPFEYEEHRKKKIREKIEEKRASRITARARLPKVNSALAEKLMKGKSSAKASLVDDRFSALFDREEFQQDVESEDYKLRNPTIGSRRDDGRDSDDDLNADGADLGLFNKIQDASDDSESDYDISEPSDDDGFDSETSDVGPKFVDDSVVLQKKNGPKYSRKGNDEDGEIIKASKRVLEKAKKAKASGVSKEVKNHKIEMFEVADGISHSKVAFSHTDESKRQRHKEKQDERIPLENRLKTQSKNLSLSSGPDSIGDLKYIKSDKGLVRSFSFIPKDDKQDLNEKKNSRKVSRDDDYEDTRTRTSRSIPQKRKR